jgi:hypothetical protein
MLVNHRAPDRKRFISLPVSGSQGGWLDRKSDRHTAWPAGLACVSIYVDGGSKRIVSRFVAIPPF